MTDLSTSLKKIMHPILGKAPQLSWEAKKAGLRSPTLPHKQCKDTLCHCQRCVFSSPHCSLPGRSQHKWNALQAASVALSLFLLLEQSGELAACGTRRAGGTFTARSRADLLLCPPSPAQPSRRAALRSGGTCQCSCWNSAGRRSSLSLLLTSIYCF